MKKAKTRFPISTMVVTATLLGVLLTCQCAFEEPSAPTWDVSFVVPLANRLYTMVDLADDSDEIIIDPREQSLVYRHRQEMESFEVGEYLRVDGGEDTLTMFLPPGVPADWDTTLIGEVRMSDAIVVDHAEIAEGYVDFWTTNPTGYNVQVEVTVPSLTRNGEPLPIQMNVQQGEGHNRTLLNSAALALGGTNEVDYTARIEVIGGDDSIAGVIDVSVAISDIHFKSVTGVLDHVEADLDTVEAELDIPDEMESFRVQSAFLELAMMLGYIIPVDVHLVVEALDARSSGVTTKIALDGTLTPTSRTDTTTVDLGDVADILNSHPERVLIYGTVELGDGETSETLSDTDRIGGSALIEAPFIFSLSTNVTETDPDTLDIDEDDRETIRDNLLQARIEAEVGNHLPFGTRVTLLFDTTRTDSTLYDEGYTPALIVGPLEVSGAPTEGNPGLVTAEVISRLVVDLDKDDLAIFENEHVYMGTRIVVLGAGEEMVKVRPADYINVRANLRARVRTDFGEDEREGR